MDGPQPISYAEIINWLTCTGIHILYEEIHILTRMDDAYRNQVAIEQDEDRTRQEADRKGKKK